MFLGAVPVLWACVCVSVASSLLFSPSSSFLGSPVFVDQFCPALGLGQWWTKLMYKNPEGHPKAKLLNAFLSIPFVSSGSAFSRLFLSRTDH